MKKKLMRMKKGKTSIWVPITLAKIFFFGAEFEEGFGSYWKSMFQFMWKTSTNSYVQINHAIVDCEVLIIMHNIVLIPIL